MPDIRRIESLLQTLEHSNDLVFAVKLSGYMGYLFGVSIMSKANRKSAKHTVSAARDETPAETFHRLAQGRTNKAVKSIGLIGQLTGSSYESTEIQRRAIIEALQAALDFVKDTFEGKAKSSDKFRLPAG